MTTIFPARHRAAVLGVLFISLTVLGWNAGSPGLATMYVDPIAKIQSQDESYYASISFRMAERGDWLTPRFLDRYTLTKPPLLYWLQTTAIEALGRRTPADRPIAVRLPSILAGAATVTLVFAWLLAESVPLAAAAAGAMLLLSSHLFFVLSRIGLTDALLTFETTLAMFALARDPGLESPAGLWTFGIASGAAILTKGIAGLFALMALAVFCLMSLALGGLRPGWRRLAAVVGISSAVGGSWHLYQLYRNTRWFWAEYVLTEIIGNSVGKPQQTTQDSQAGYYLKRFLALDAPLFVAAVVAWLAPGSRGRSRVLLAWIAAVLAAALSFEYRNTSYILPVFPALALLVAGSIPPRFAKPALALTVILFVAKAAMPAKTWGIPFRAESEIAVEPVLDRYAAMRRGNALILGEPDDGFSSACLDLPRVRYLFLDPNTERNRYALDFEELGITVTANDYSRLSEVQPEFHKRLRDWGLDTSLRSEGDPVATVIIAPAVEQIRALVHDHPGADFLLPIDWASKDDGVHEVQSIGDGRELLLSREMVQRP